MQQIIPFIPWEVVDECQEQLERNPNAIKQSATEVGLGQLISKDNVKGGLLVFAAIHSQYGVGPIDQNVFRQPIYQDIETLFQRYRSENRDMMNEVARNYDLNIATHVYHILEKDRAAWGGIGTTQI